MADIIIGKALQAGLVRQTASCPYAHDIAENFQRRTIGADSGNRLNVEVFKRVTKWGNRNLGKCGRSSRA